jgi:hypothetical protein
MTTKKTGNNNGNARATATTTADSFALLLNDN